MPALAEHEDTARAVLLGISDGGRRDLRALGIVPPAWVAPVTRDRCTLTWGPDGEGARIVATVAHPTSTGCSRSLLHVVNCAKILLGRIVTGLVVSL